MTLDPFVRSYLEALLWLATTPEGAPLDRQYSVKDLPAHVIESARAECIDFRHYLANLPDGAELLELVDSEPERAGHDFYLTRCRHGAGFWDGRWPCDTGRRLTEAAHTFGPQDLYFSDGQWDLV